MADKALRFIRKDGEDYLSVTDLTLWLIGLRDRASTTQRFVLQTVLDAIATRSNEVTHER